MNGSNQLTKIAIDQDMVLGQVAKDLTEINRLLSHSRKLQLKTEKTFLEALRDDIIGLIKQF